MIKRYFNQQGRTALEMFFVLVILGVITSSVYGLISNVFVRRANTETVLQIQNLVDDIKSKFAWRGPNSTSGYTVSGGDIGKYLSDEKIIKNYNNGYINSKSGSKISFASDNNSFTLKIEGLSESLCTVLLTTSWGNELVDWSISSSDSANWQSSLNKKLPQKMNEAQQLCNAKDKNVWLKFR